MSRKESEEVFLNALESLLIENKEFGINALAEKAGLNKVLIYRYFNGWDGLLEAYARKINLWRTIRDEFEEGLKSERWNNSTEAVFWLFKIYRIKLLSSPVYLRILKEELFRPNPLTRKLEVEREEEGIIISSLLVQSFGELQKVNVPALGAFVVSALTYIALKSTQVTVFNGLDLSLDESWEQMDKIWEISISTILSGTVEK